jgi:hypothetical protein
MLVNLGFRQGLAEGTAELAMSALGTAKLNAECTWGTLVGTGEACVQDVTASASNVFDHPGDFLGSMVDAQDFQQGLQSGDFSEWAGHIVPSLRLAAATAGTAGAVAKGSDAAP